MARFEPSEILKADQDGIRGEAIFLRAHYHFEAYRMWGNIPYYTEADSTPVAQGGYRKANDQTPAQIIGNIIADLNQAAALLPATPRNGEKGRVTKWAALAYKGRVQVYGAAITPALYDSALVSFSAVMAGTPHLPGTREYFSCLEGAVAIFVAGDRYDLAAGDVLAFPGNVAHSYRNPDAAAPAMGISVVILAKAGV